MDPSSAIQPEASTVHRPVPSDEGIATKNEGSASPDEQEPDEQEPDEQEPDERSLDERSLDERELEGAETVIRQDPPAAPGGGSSRREGSSRRTGSHSGIDRFAAGAHGDSGYDSSRRSDSGPLPQPSDHTPASLTRELTGQRLNHFELIEQIGGGGMGAVFRAVDDRLGRTVAVKVVPFAAGDPDLQRRFRNEAQSAAKLDHPLIARVFEVGNDGPWYYIVFEYIDGRNIRDIVSQQGPLSLDDAVYYTCQVAEAIGHASRRGIVHRDIKPSNIVVTEESSIKLVDMGLARSENFDASEDMTASGVTLGTFDYISPEQAHDPRLADIRSDLYSLGCTFYYMLTGAPPYPGGTMLQKLLNHGNAAIPDIRDRRSDASDDLTAILRKMLAKQPHQRYQNSQTLIADLRELALRENLRRSRGVDVVTVEGDSILLRRLLRHLPWVVATMVLFGSAVGLEVLSWQQRGEFSSKVAATIPETAMESVPVSASRTNVSPPRSMTHAPFSAGPSTSSELPRAAAPAAGESEGKTAGRSATRDSNANSPSQGSDRESTRLLESGEADSSRRPALSSGNEPLHPGSLPLQNDRQGQPGSMPDNDPERNPDNQAPQPRVDGSIGSGSPPDTAPEPNENAAGAIPNPSMAASALLPQSPPVAALPDVPPRVETARSGADRLPSDPPSLRNFPVPIDSTPQSDTRPANAPPGRDPAVSNDDRANENQAANMSQNDGGGSSSKLDNRDRTTVLDPPHSVRIVTSESLLSRTFVKDAENEGVVLTASLADALQLARQHHVERIEINTPLLRSEPVTIEEDDLVISSSVPGGTAIVFTSNRDADMQRSDMITIGSNRIDLVDVHLYWTVPSSETDGGAMIAMNDNRRVRLIDCSITIDNPSRRDNIHAFNIVTGPDSGEFSETAPSATTNSLADPLPLVSIELYNVIIRGQISMLQMDVAAELQLLWENGLLAVSRRMIETGGSRQRPQPTSGSIRLSLQRLTAYTPRGLLMMRLGASTPYPVNIERQADESVFVVDRGVPQVEIDGVLREDRDKSWLRIRGASNAYEADTTLSDPMLVVRDQTGQKNTITMNDLIDHKPTWADDKTPRWVVRWSQPLPDSVSVSRLIPADFRQDGSLFAGFQEKSLPKLPMQRTLDFTPADSN